MRKYLLATTCIVALGGGAASAADLPLKGAPVAAFNWTGGYIGGHIGVARMNSECMATGYSYYSCGSSGGVGTIRDTNFAAGVRVGYDWQIDRSFVVGAVADWTWTNLNRTHVDNSYTLKAKIDWLASFRGRAGLAFDRTMVYVTGGLALARVQAEGNLISGAYLYSQLDKTAVGWVAGVGIEHHLASMPRWSVNAEVLYYDLGRHDGGTACGGCSSYTYQNEYHFEVFEARVGVNYRF